VKRKDRQSGLVPDHHVEAAFRFQIVSPLLNDSLSKEDKKSYRRSILRHKQEHPTRGPIRITSRTLRRWTRAYRDAEPNRRVDSLVPLPRSGGRRQIIPVKAVELAQSLLEENARRNTGFLINEIEKRHPELVGQVKNSTLNRHLRLLGVNRRVLDDNGEPAKASFKPFQAKRPNDLWQSDVHHGPLAIVKGQLVATKIIAWIDDYSRRCCHCQAYPDETLPMLENCLQQAVQKCGVPSRVYTDNGAIYSGIQFALICADLGMHPSFSAPFSPWTHGKIERLWGIQEDQLWSEISLVDPMPIERLNHLLQCWVGARYHQHVHSQTGQTPRERWHQGLRTHEVSVRHPTEAQIKRIFWLWERREVTSTSLVKLHKNTYAVDSKLAGETVLVRYDPCDLSVVQLWSNTRRPEPHGDFTAQAPLVASRAPNPTAPPKDHKKPSAAAQRYLDALEREYEQREQQTFGLIPFPTNSSKEVID